MKPPWFLGRRALTAVGKSNPMMLVVVCKTMIIICRTKNQTQQAFIDGRLFLTILTAISWSVRQHALNMTRSDPASVPGAVHECFPRGLHLRSRPKASNSQPMREGTVWKALTGAFCSGNLEVKTDQTNILNRKGPKTDLKGCESCESYSKL